MQGLSHTPGCLEGKPVPCLSIKVEFNCNLLFCLFQDGLVFRIQVAYHREPQVLRESVNAEGMLIVRDNEEAQALEMATSHKPLLTSMLHG